MPLSFSFLEWYSLNQLLLSKLSCLVFLYNHQIDMGKVIVCRCLSVVLFTSHKRTLHYDLRLDI